MTEFPFQIEFLQATEYKKAEAHSLGNQTYTGFV